MRTSDPAKSKHQSDLVADGTQRSEVAELTAILRRARSAGLDTWRVVHALDASPATVARLRRDGVVDPEVAKKP